jgi:hypothetical protein
MEEKIKQYVSYHFRFDPREDVESIIEEVTSNLIDRYYELLEKTNNEQKAYIEAIKSMGSFKSKDDIPELYKLKPDWADIAFIVSAILSIFAVIAMFIDSTLGFVLTLSSILLFSGAAYYFYAQAQYTRKEELDIEKHNIYLTKIFSYLKTCFVFWTINLAIVFSSITTGWIVFMTLANSTITNPTNISIGGYIIITLLSFSIGIIIFALIAKLIYDRLLMRYRMQTGLASPQSKIKASYDYLSVKDDNVSNRHTSNFIVTLNKKFTNRVISFMLLGGLLFTVLSPLEVFLLIQHENGWYFLDPDTIDRGVYILVLIKLSLSIDYYFLGILGLLGLVQLFIVILLGLLNKIRATKTITLSFITWVSLSMIMFITFDAIDRIGHYLSPLFMVPVLVMIFVGLIKLIISIFLPKPFVNKEV